MVNTFGAGKNAFSQTPVPHQERVNTEMFKAIEMLGRRLERSEGERERLQRRLALIESAATVDEKTGKLYLPVVVDPQTAPQLTANTAPRWTAAASLMSSAIALLALGVVLFREPDTGLTAKQLAALNALAYPQSQVAKFEDRTWKTIRRDAPKKEEQAEETYAEEKFASAFSNVKEEEDRLATEDRPWNRKPNAVKAAAPVENNGGAVAENDGEALPDDDMLALEESNAEEPAATDMASAAKELAAIEPVAGEEEATDVSNVYIPGEDKPSEKASKKEVKKPEPKIAEAQKQEPKEEPKPAVAAKKPAPAEKPVETAAHKSVENAIGASTIARDPALPEKLAQLEKRAFEGVPEAQHDLATLYASGKLVSQDYKRSAYWFSQAADGGVANAHYNLGVMFQQGLGVKQDMKKAIGWYEKAAELGHPEAMYNLGIAYIEGVGTDRNIDRGVSFFKRAANAGVSQAAYNLGVLYESNFIGSIDTSKALEWYQVAANENHADAIAAIERIKGQMGTVSDQALTLADMVEPAAGGDEEEGVGQGDASLPGDEMPAIVSKSSSHDILLLQRIQAILARQGFLPGKPTGTLDAQTEDAIRAWQKQQGLKADGIPSATLLEKMEDVAGKN